MIAALVLAATLSINDYATMPQLAAPQFSPDGKRIAYVLTQADLARSAYDADVWLIDSDGKNSRRLTFANATDNRPRWSPDGTRIAFLSDRTGRNAIFIINADGGEARQLSTEPTAVREFEWSPDGKQIAFTRPDEATPEEEKRAKDRDDARVIVGGTKHLHLHVAEVESGKVRRVTSGAYSIFNFSWAPDSKRIAFDRGTGTTLDDLYRTDIYVTTLDGEVTPVVVRPGLDRGPTFSPDGQSIAFTSGGGVEAWIIEHDVFVVPANGGTPRKVSAAYGRTPEAIEWTSDSRALLLEGPWNTSVQLFRVNADGSGFTPLTPRDAVSSDCDTHGARVACITQSLMTPPELVVDGKPLTNHNAAYRDRELGETRVIRWKNPKDGLEIEGLLTLPAGYKSGRVPLITFVHGGPASHFFQGFLGYVGHLSVPHVLASRGIAMLRPNPRGSGGYGLAFRAANVNDWGGLDWLDINAGIDKVIADGIADPNRLGLIGWSYGGYIAAHAAATSDRFRAISIGAAITDLLSYHGTSDVRDFIPSYFPNASLDVLRAHSPLWQLTKKPSAKVLMQHGENDERVPLSQSIMFYRRLDELGADVTLVVYPRSGHGTREPKLRMDMARRNVELFESTLLRD